MDSGILGGSADPYVVLELGFHVTDTAQRSRAVSTQTCVTERDRERESFIKNCPSRGV